MSQSYFHWKRLTDIRNHAVNQSGTLVAILLSLEAAHRYAVALFFISYVVTVAILLSLEAAHRYMPKLFCYGSLILSQSYFHWKRLTD